jgi:hypothetical protein
MASVIEVLNIAMNLVVILIIWYGLKLVLRIVGRESH